MEDNNPTFDLTVINPDIIIGPMLQYVPGPNSVNETNTFAVYNFMNGFHKSIDGLTFPFYHFVSDLAEKPKRINADSTRWTSET